MENDYFDIEKLTNPCYEEVEKELDLLNDEVCRITNGVGKIRLQPISDDEAKLYFNDDIMDENYYLVFTYTNKKTNSQVRNKFAVLSYAEVYPVLVKPLKIEKSVESYGNPKALRGILKTLVNDESVLRSVRLAIKQSKEKIEK